MASRPAVRSEGMGRVLVEAFCGAAPSLGRPRDRFRTSYRTGRGILVPTDDPAALADALVRLLSDRELSERLGRGARASAAQWVQTPEEYAARLRAMVA